MTIAIIPARIGSKRIKKKNVKLFFGKPIIFYSIQAAKRSGLFSRIVVTTDSIKISNIAKKYGADVFFRSKNLSNDSTMLAPVILNVLRKKEYSKEKYACCIYATAPLINFKDLKKSFLEIKIKKSNACHSVTDYDFPVVRSLVFSKPFIHFKYKKFKNIASQKTPKIVHDAGQFFWIKVEYFLKSKDLFPKKTLGYYIEKERTQDIDTMHDWYLALYKYKKLIK
jgi:pseudaminic acid cytidylyltransferase